MPTLTTQDTTLYYEKINSHAENPWLVFLHEGLGCVDLWGDFPLQLCEALGYPGIVFDRIGHGKSSANTTGYTLDYLQQCARLEIPLILDHIVGDRPCILVGHSDGGSIALIVASENRPNVNAVITLAAHTFVEQETVEGVQQAKQAYEAGKLHKLFQLHGDNTEALFTHWSSTWLNPEFIHWHILDMLPAIRSPILAFQGNNDAYGTEKQVAPILRANAALHQVEVIPDCGHNPHAEHRDWVIARIQQFLLS